MRFHVLHPRDQLVKIMRRIYDAGMTTLSGGNLSIKDSQGEIWITPAAVDKGRLTADDIVWVRSDGTLQGAHAPSSELPFHRAIYAARPDLGAIVHAHPPALVAFSIARHLPETDVIPQVRRVCGPVGFAPYALPGSEQLGQHIAATFAEGFDVVLLENHGVVCAGPDLMAAFQRLETLDFCARTLIRAQALGGAKTLSEEQLALFDTAHHQLPAFEPQPPDDHEAKLRQQIVELVRRAGDRQLMTSTEGVVSGRIDATRFLITPTGLDRQNLQPEDIVLIDAGRREAGKLPSRSLRLHTAIYDRHPGIHAVMSGQPPHATAFAIAGADFDTRTIPESFILLRRIPLIPYALQYTDPAKVAARLSLQTPVLLIRNDGVLTAGRSLLETFDRLEVLEYSARALLDTPPIGPVAPISPDAIAALEQAFPAEPGC